jgi:exportin-2 (importin alpha re-exporter)
MIESLAGDAETLKIAMETHRLMARIFFSLNWQTLPEYFEDNIQFWMAEFAKFLSYSNPLLEKPGEDSEPSPVDSLKSAIIENLSFLYFFYIY